MGILSRRSCDKRKTTTPYSLQLGGEISQLEIGNMNINKRYISHLFSMNAINLHIEIT
jgi:hypothetical protein